MINDIISMNGYGIYVWSAFAFTLISFTALYTVIKVQLIYEKFTNFSSKLASELVKFAFDYLDVSKTHPYCFALTNFVASRL